jgi:hypothetical protein
VENRPENRSPAVRASDADREAVRASDADLALVMRGLRAHLPAAAAPTATRDVGIITGFRRRGRWTVGRAFQGWR